MLKGAGNLSNKKESTVIRETEFHVGDTVCNKSYANSKYLPKKYTGTVVSISYGGHPRIRWHYQRYLITIDRSKLAILARTDNVLQRTYTIE